MKSVLVTGASTGIGAAMAVHLTRKGWSVFAGVRSNDDADRLSGHSPGIVPLHLDVTNKSQILSAATKVSDALNGATLNGLVNNAGIAQMGPLTLQPIDEIRAHFEVNVLGAIAVSQAFAPLLGQDASRHGSPGRIVNVTSVGGEVASPFLGAYTATKHAMESVTDTLRRELKMFGIDAIAVGPGAVRTPIWDKATSPDGHAYHDTPWAISLSTFLDAMVSGGKNGLPVEYVSEVIETALTHKRPRARYAPVPNKLINYHLLRLLPKRWVDTLFIKRLGLDEPAAR